jgi:hypothetical protein
MSARNESLDCTFASLTLPRRTEGPETMQTTLREALGPLVSGATCTAHNCESMSGRCAVRLAI